MSTIPMPLCGPSYARAATLALVVLLVSQVGCRTTSTDRELLERELRLQEDKIYVLQDKVEQYRTLLASCRQQNSELIEELHGSDNTPGDPQRMPGKPRMPDVEGPPQVEGVPSGVPGPPPGVEGPAGQAGPLVPPVIRPPHPNIPESGEEFAEDDSAGRRFEPSGRISEASDPFPRNRMISDREVRLAAATSDHRVVRVTFDKRLTGGWNSDGKFGDEGVAMVIEMRNAANEVVSVPATISVVVSDPSMPPDQSRVDRWDLAPQEVADQFRKSFLGHGVHLELPWNSQPPCRGKLHLYVRVVTADGEEFRIDRPLKIDVMPELQGIGMTPGPPPAPPMYMPYLPR